MSLTVGSLLRAEVAHWQRRTEVAERDADELCIHVQHGRVCRYGMGSTECDCGCSEAVDAHRHALAARHDTENTPTTKGNP